jgi:hypothetical protein
LQKVAEGQQKAIRIQQKVAEDHRRQKTPEDTYRMQQKTAEGNRM